ELWKTDGTTAGATLVHRFEPGRYVHSLTPLGDLLALRTDGQYRRGELWRSDGTDAGTTLVAPISTPRTDAVLFDPHQPVPFGSALLFHAIDSGGRGLFRSDLTAASTTLRKRYDAGTDSSSPSS